LRFSTADFNLPRAAGACILAVATGLIGAMLIVTGIRASVLSDAVIWRVWAYFLLVPYPLSLA